MKKLPQFLLTVAMLLSANLARAYDVKVDGICYNLDKENKTATVTRGETVYEGYIIIPSTISTDGATYTVEQVDFYSFCESNISGITLPNTITRIEGGTFSWCYNMTDCILSNSLTKIEKGTFESCTSLKEITIPNSVEVIELGAFHNCDKLTSITIPSSVCEIEGAYVTFGNCDSLKEIIVDQNNKSFSSENGVLFNKDKTIVIAYPYGKDDKEYVIPTTAKTIGNGAFDSAKISKISIPSMVEEIGDAAFEGSALTIVDIPQSVNKIGSTAFFYCDLLREVYVHWEDPSVIEKLDIPVDIFYEAYGDSPNNPLEEMTLYVPVGSKSIYLEYSPWDSFGNIIESLPGAVENINSDSRDLPCVAFSLTGIRMAKAENLELLEKSLDKGIYVVRFSDGNNRKLIVK